MDDDLAAVWSRVTDWLGSHQVAVFPAAVTPGREATVVSWPDADWAAFLNIAERVGVPLIYASHDVLVEEDLPDAESHAELHAQARAHLGGVCRIDLAFAFGGVLHVFAAESPWLDDVDQVTLDDRVGRYQRRAEQRDAVQAEVDKLAPLIDELTHKLSEEASFLSARAYGDRYAAAEEALPQLAEWMNARSDDEDDEDAVAGAHRIAAHRVIQDATLLAEKVKVARVAQARSREGDLLADLLADGEFAAAPRWSDKERRIREFVKDRLGFPSTDLTARLYAAARRELGARPKPTPVVQPTLE